jgi:hypothetical protein
LKSNHKGIDLFSPFEKPKGENKKHFGLSNDYKISCIDCTLKCRPTFSNNSTGLICQ